MYIGALERLLKGIYSKVNKIKTKMNPSQA